MTTTATTRQPDQSSPAPKLPPARKVSAVVIALWRFVRLPAKPAQSDDERQRYTELIARHDAFFFIELPMRQAMLSMEIAAMQHVAEMRRCEAQRKMAEENAKFYEALAKLYQPNNELRNAPPSGK